MTEDFWQGYTQATCLPDKCFCEAVHYGDLIRQPMNTWSNLAFVVVGLYLAYLLTPRNKLKYPLANNHLNRNTIYTWMFVFACVVVGFGSLFYHASLIFVGQWLDNVGMYLVVSLFIIYNLDRMLKLGTKQGLFLFIVANIVFSLAAYFVPESRRFLFAGLLAIYIVVEIVAGLRLQNKSPYRYLALTLVLFAVSVGIWTKDLNKQWCDPDSLLQGHAIWHLLNALACLTWYHYFWAQVELDEPPETA